MLYLYIARTGWRAPLWPIVIGGLTDGSTRRLSANAIVVDTGSRPARPTIPGLAAVPADAINAT